MKKLSIFFLFFNLFLGQALAEGDYTYTDNKDGTITIKEYIGPTITDLVVPKTINGKTVSGIKKLLGSSTTIHLEKLYIPEGITATGQAITNHSTLKCGVIDLNFNNSAVYPFYYNSSFNSSDSKLESIFVFGEQVYTSENLIGSTYSSDLFHLGSISVTYDNDQSDVVQMYNWGPSDINKKTTVNQTRFEYFLWALEQHLACQSKTLSDVKTVDLTGLNKKIGNKGVSFSFGEYNPASQLPNATVIQDNQTTYNAPVNTPTIADGQDFVSPTADGNYAISYSRSNTKGWNTVCLPFAIHETDFPSGTRLYTISNTTAGSNATASSIVLSPVTEVAAGEPCFVYSEAENWTLSLTDRAVSKDVTPQAITCGGWTLRGSFTTQTIGSDKYKLHSSGTVIGKTKSNEAKVSPYRCYLEANTSPNSAPSRITISTR